MSTAQLVPVLLALLTANLVAQGKVLNNWVFTCPMHPKVQAPEKGACPICGMELFTAPPTPKKIQIPPGGLRGYCEKYVEEALQGRQRGGSAFDLVSAYVGLRGRGSRKRLRGLLEVAEHAWFWGAAFHLGRLQDRESVPLLKKLLVDKKHVISQLYIAGALHEMGVAEGLRALEEFAETPYGYLKFSAMALRDSPRVRESLAAAFEVEDEYLRSAAVSAQLRLGLEENFQEAVRLLGSDEPQVRDAVILGLGDSGMQRAIEPLMRIVRDDRLPRTARVSAARGLVKLGERKYQGFLMDAFHKAAVTDDRFRVVYALGEVGDQKVLPLLETVIEDEGVMRATAVAAAAKILGREAARADKK